MSANDSVPQLKTFAENAIKSEPLMELEYFEIADAESLQPIDAFETGKSAVACIALKLGSVRLIDNIILR